MTDDKMVPEKDLIALKEGQVKVLADLRTEYAGEITKLAGEHTSTSEGLQSQIKTGTEEASRLRATVAELEEKGTNHTSTAEELKGAKGELKTAKDSLKALQGNVSDGLRTRLTGEFKIPETALEGKTLDQLEVIMEALAATRSPQSSQYTAGGGSGGEPAKTGRDKIKQGLAAGDLRAT